MSQAIKVEFFHPTYYDDEPEPYLEMPARDRPGWDGFCTLLRKADWMEPDSSKLRVTAIVACKAINIELEDTDGARLRGIYWCAERRDL